MRGTRIQLQPWTDEELAELEREETWDLDHVVVHGPVENRGAQVQVAFATQEFRAIAEAARSQAKVVEYIHEAALERANSDTASVADSAHNNG